MIVSSRYRPLVLAALLAAVLLVGRLRDRRRRVREAFEGTGIEGAALPRGEPALSAEPVRHCGGRAEAGVCHGFESTSTRHSRSHPSTSTWGRPKPPEVRGRTSTSGSSLRYYRLVEEGGNRDATVLDRLCEVSLLVGDDRAFARYAKRNADLYPFERQLYNLGLAYYGVEDYQSVVKTQKEAIEKFRTSAYLGGYYRLVGLAYVKQGRDQTAERTFVAGVKAVDARLTELGRAQRPAAEDIARLSEDRVGMLLQLKRLFQIYKKQGELDQVERQLKDATKQMPCRASSFPCRGSTGS